MFNLRIQAAALPLVALILSIFALPAVAAPEPNTVLEVEGVGLSHLDVQLTPKGSEPVRLQLKADEGHLVAGIGLPQEVGTEYEIAAYDTEGRVTHAGKGSIPPFSAIERPVRLGLPPTLEKEGNAEGLIVSLSRERLVLEAFESEEPNHFTVDLQALDVHGNPLKIDPNDIKWGLTDPTHFELLSLKERFQAKLIPKDTFPKPLRLCDVPPVVIACLPNSLCKPIRVCPDPFEKVSAGGSHTCALTKSGAAMCWGLNNEGQLGYPTTNSCNSAIGVGSHCSTRPRRVECPTGAPCRFTQIAVGHTLTVAVDTNGDAWWWGRGAPAHNKVTATLAGNPVGFTSVAAGYGHGCAISSGRSEVWCWGANAYGEAGAPLPMIDVPSSAPVRVLVPMKFRKIVAGGEHTCGIGSSGYDIVCWGRDDENQTRGPNSSQIGQFFFQHFGGLTSILDVAASSNRTCVTLGLNNGVRCWGSIVNLNVMPFGMPERLTTGFGHVCATASQQASCVGTNNWSELGTGNTMLQTSPVPVKAPPPLYANIAAGDSHTCGLTPDGEVYCWGSNISGQVGTGAATYSVKEPAKVLTP